MRSKKILCPFHREDTPSLALYENGSYKCYGCGASGKTKNLDLNIEELPQFGTRPRFKENLEETFKYIDSLPKKIIRGLMLPYDSDYYYITWEDKKFYKKRLVGNTKDKYRSAIGHYKPIMKLNITNNKSMCFIVEGEINALTLQACGIDNPIFSPGSANEFNRKDYVDSYLQYDNICIIVDKDAAGVLAGIELKARLERAKKTVTLYPMETDLNDLYVQHGRQEILNQTTKAMALFRVRVPKSKDTL